MEQGQKRETRMIKEVRLNYKTSLSELDKLSPKK